jgi:hypothetical protein
VLSRQSQIGAALISSTNSSRTKGIVNGFGIDTASLMMGSSWMKSAALDDVELGECRRVVHGRTASGPVGEGD